MGVRAVRHTKEFGHIIFLRLLDSKNQYLPVYIGTQLRRYSLVCLLRAGLWDDLTSATLTAGDSESNALEMQLQHKQSVCRAEGLRRLSVDSNS